MENNERQNSKLSIDRDAQIQVVVNNAGADEITINLGRVFHRMKLNRRIYAWVLVLCMTVGACAPLLMYQFTRAPLTVSSVVTLKYRVANNAEVTDSAAAEIDTEVTDLTAPDGGTLDLNQITSSYVLQNALDGLKLSHPISTGTLRNNITVERILSEESRRQQEVAASMVEDKNNGAYTAVQELQLKYENTFVVSLKNGFGEEDARTRVELKDDELRQVLDQVLTWYNEYLVMTYANIKLPDDEISAIDVENIDILESLDQLRTAVENLYAYCESKPLSIQAYRSWRTGRSLLDWMETMETVRDVSVEYLYSYIYTNSIVKDKNMMITRYQYQLRDAQTRLDVINENIATVQTILDSYKNDEIYVSMQESDAAKTTKTTTDYYNELILQQAENYAQAERLEVRIADLQDKVASLGKVGSETTAEAENLEAAKDELESVINASLAVYNAISEHMEELLEQPIYTTYAVHSTALGKTDNFLSASMKRIIIGLVLGAIIGCGLWFVSAVAPEFSQKRKEEEETSAKTNASGTEEEATEQ